MTDELACSRDLAAGELADSHELAVGARRELADSYELAVGARRMLDPQEGARSATISDVAQRAGVSIKTVSRVANAEPNVREVTRLRVQKAIDELGYQANPYARYLSMLKRRAD